MPYLIDGYNLLHAMGLVHSRTAPTALRKARLGLLGLLSSAFGDEASSVTVIFDAARAPRGVPSEEDYHGVHVRYAIHQAQADDLIEALIREASAPRRLTVVSNDRRIQKAAERRQCQAMPCGEFLDELERRRRKPDQKAAVKSKEPERPFDEEKEHWLKEFAELENDPALRELSDPQEWREFEE